MGRLKILGTGFIDILNGTAADEDIIGFRGDDTLNGGEGNDRLIGGKGNDILDGGAGNDRLRGDQGNDLLTGGEGRDRFIFNLQGDSDIVTDYTDETDRLDFSNFGFADANALLATASQTGADVLFSMATGETMTLQNVQLSSLEATDFII
jgi:Ca2+-binding RTX toxin-like protein